MLYSDDDCPNKQAIKDLLFKAFQRKASSHEISIIAEHHEKATGSKQPIAELGVMSINSCLETGRNFGPPQQWRNAIFKPGTEYPFRTVINRAQESLGWEPVEDWTPQRG